MNPKKLKKTFFLGLKFEWILSVNTWRSGTDSIRNIVVIFQTNILRIVGFYVRHSAIVFTKYVGSYFEGTTIRTYVIDDKANTVCFWSPIYLIFKNSDEEQKDLMRIVFVRVTSINDSRYWLSCYHENSANSQVNLWMKHTVWIALVLILTCIH